MIGELKTYIIFPYSCQLNFLALIGPTLKRSPIQFGVTSFEKVNANKEQPGRCPVSVSRAQPIRVLYICFHNSDTLFHIRPSQGKPQMVYT